MVRFAKFKNWYTLENDPCLIIQVLSTLELPKSPNSRNFRLAKIKCFTVLGVAHSIQWKWLLQSMVITFLDQKLRLTLKRRYLKNPYLASGLISHFHLKFLHMINILTFQSPFITNTQSFCSVQFT